MKIDRKKSFPVYLVIQIENKNDFKGKKRFFTIFDQNIATIFMMNTLKTMEKIHMDVQKNI